MMAAGALLATLSSGDWKLPTANTPSAIGSHFVLQNTLSFEGGDVPAQKIFCVDVRMPTIYGGGTIRLLGQMVTGTAKGGTARFKAWAKKFSTSETLANDSNVGSTVTQDVTVPTTAGYPVALDLSIPKDSAAAGDWVRLFVTRENRNSNDTSNDTLFLVAASVIEGS